MDILLALQARWPLVAVMVAVVIVYLATMDFRRFLTIVGMGIVFQLMWESINVGIRAVSGFGFPYFSLSYVWSPYDEFMIGIPWSVIFFKGIVYSCGSYITASMAGRKYIDSKVDLVSDRGHRVTEHIKVGGFASMLYTVCMLAIDPVIVNGGSWFLGDYEQFTINNIYFGIDPLYFVGCLVSSYVTFILIGLIESRIEYQQEDMLFDYDNTKQKPFVHHQAGFFILSAAVFVPSILALVNEPSIGIVNFVAVIPAMYIVYALIMRWSSGRDESLVGKYCKEHPDSFVCKMR